MNDPYARFTSAVDQAGAAFCVLAETMCSIRHRLVEGGISEDVADEMVASLWDLWCQQMTGGGQ